jgi:small-conductance mechanosensitive channel
MDTFNSSYILQNSINLLPELISGLFTRMVVAVIILLIGFVVGKLLGKIVKNLLHSIEFNKIIKKATGINISLEQGISFFVSYFIYFLFIVMALNQFGLTTVVLHMISGAILIIIIISIFLSIKDFMPNMFSGVFIHKKKFINVGDVIRVDNTEGKVVYINLVETKIETKRGDIIYIPNSLLTKSKVTKITKRRSKTE